MTLYERLQWATEPVEKRSMALLWGGMAAFGGLAWIYTQEGLPLVAVSLLQVLIPCSWVVAACGAIGYVRWLLGQARADITREKPPRKKD